MTKPMVSRQGQPRPAPPGPQVSLGTGIGGAADAAAAIRSSTRVVPPAPSLCVLQIS